MSSRGCMGPTKSFFAIFVVTKDFCLPLAVSKVIDVFHAFKSVCRAQSYLTERSCVCFAC